MTVNNIREVKGVDEENFDYLLAQSDIKIPSVFKTRNSDPIPANIPLTTEVIVQPIAAASFDNDVKAYWPSSVQRTKGSTKFSFKIEANDYSIYDLRDAEFNIQVQYGYLDEGTASQFPCNYPSFGNQALLSLFEYIELFIDGKCIGRSTAPGFNSNANYALRYPHCKTLEKDYEISGYTSTDPAKYSAFNAKTTGATTAIAPFDNQSITLNVYENNATQTAVTKRFYTGFITQRIKLSDLFFIIKTLPPIYNHCVEIKFQRSAHNYLICNTNTVTGIKAQCLGINTFNLRQDVYTLTDQLAADCKKYYAQPVETIITLEKQQLVDFMTVPSSGSGTSFNINLETAYKNKLLTIAIPRTNDFSNQYNKVENRYAASYASVSDINNSTNITHYDTFKAPANSYTYGGIRSLIVQTLNGVKLYRFEPEIEGIVEGPKTMFRLDKPETQINFLNAGDNIKMANYEDVYKQYIKARKHFWEEENEALDYQTFLKEYCIFCIDLSPFKLSPNENIMINIQYSEWSGNYNPYYTNNDSEHGTNYSSRILCNLYYDKILKIGDGVLEIKNMFDEKKEAETVNMA